MSSEPITCEEYESLLKELETRAERIIELGKLSVDRMVAKIDCTNDRDVLRRMSKAIKARWAKLDSREKMYLHVGQRVQAHSLGRGVINGVIFKVNRKTVKVMADDGIEWRVPIGSLKRSE
jgi:hypothetical protein